MKSIAALTVSALLIFPCAAIFQSKKKIAKHVPSNFEKLTKLIEQADKVVVYEQGIGAEKILFTSSERKDIAEFKEAFTFVESDEWFKCACMSTPTVRLYREGKELVEITYFSPEIIRASIWESDTRLNDPEKWLKWFDDRKITGPRKEYEADLARIKQQEISHARWQNAMPKSIRPLWKRLSLDQYTSGLLSPDLAPLRKALTKEFPDKAQRILALLAWFGSGDGPWSGFPAYEAVAEDLLFDFSTTDILSALASTTMTDTQREGIARFFAGWDFYKKREKDSEIIPAELKKVLLAHSLKSTDEDKRDRAKAAFEK